MQQNNALIPVIMHIRAVQELLAVMAVDLQARALTHDQSKYTKEELPLAYAKSRLDSLEYGGEEFRAAIEELKPAVQHHYAHNSHHPEHYPHGWAGMTLLDMLEMMCDLRASLPNADYFDVLDAHAEKHGIPKDVVLLMKNTAMDIGWLK